MVRRRGGESMERLHPADAYARYAVCVGWVPTALGFVRVCGLSTGQNSIG